MSCLLIRDLNTLLIMGRRLIGRYLEGSDFPPEPLKTGTTEACFQLGRNTDFDRNKRYNFQRTEDGSGGHIFKAIAGIQSGPVDFEMPSP